MAVELKSFPFDSMKVLNEESGKMEGDRKYDARIFQNFFRKFLSNGVYYGHYKNLGENSMKPILDGGLNVKILKGTGIIEGADFELENDTILSFERPVVGERKDRIVVKKDSTLSVRETSMYIKQGNGMTPANLQRDDNVYEICIAEIIVKSTTNLSETDVKDTRLDKELCGIVSSLISVDGNELYQRFQQYIDSVTENLVRKDQDAVLNGSFQANSINDVNNKGLTTNDFTNEYKAKLDSIAEGATKNTAVASTTVNGLMSKEDKTKLNGIASGANNYVHPSDAGNKHIPSGGSSGQILRWSANGTATWGNDNNTTYGVASTSSDGLMSASDKNKLNGIATGATRNIIKVGTANPSGGSNGDIYLQYF